MIRSVLPPMSLVPAVRRAVAEIDRTLPLEGIKTQKLALKESLSQERLYASLCGSLALLALALSCIGLYGIMAYNVARRTGEVGIRMALGATSSDVLKAVLRQGLKLTLVGLAIGLAGAFATTRVISSLLYDVSPTDPLTFVCMSLFLVGVALLACYIPAHRAARIDPMTALRYE